MYQECPDAHLQEQIPVGLTALREQLKIHQSDQNYDSVISVLHKLIDHLFRADWIISASYFHNTLNEIHETIREIKDLPVEIAHSMEQLTQKYAGDMPD